MQTIAGHTRIPKGLELPSRFQFTQRYLTAFDRDLRLRRSAESPHFYVLERRKRRAPVRYVGLRNLTDQHIQARDGYDHVGLVHPNWLPKPDRLVYALVNEGWDIWNQQTATSSGANAVADQMEQEEDWAQENRARRRKQMFHRVALDSFDVLNRMGNPDGTERARMNNVGIPAPAADPAGVNP